MERGRKKGKEEEARRKEEGESHLEGGGKAKALLCSRGDGDHGAKLILGNLESS